MKKKTIIKGQEKNDGVRVIDCTPIYKGQRLHASDMCELNLQLAIMHHNHTGMFRALKNVITNCSDDTLQLIADAIAGKVPKKDGPKVDHTKNILNKVKLANDFEDEYKKPGMNRTKAIEAVINRYPTLNISTSTVDKALAFCGVGVKTIRKR